MCTDRLCLNCGLRHAGGFARMVSVATRLSLLSHQGLPEGGECVHQTPGSHYDSRLLTAAVRP